MFIFNSLEEYLITSLIIFISQFIYSVVGFASGMVAISLLTLIYGNPHIYVPLLVMLCIPTEVSVYIKDYKHIKFSYVKPILLFAIPLLILGAWTLKQAFFYYIAELCLGIIIMIIAFYYIFFPNINLDFFPKDKLITKTIFGMLSGILGGIFGISGPPLVIYYKLCNLNKAEFRSTMIGSFLPMSSLRLISYYFLGFYNYKMMYTALSLYPFIILAIISGNLFYKKITEKTFKFLISIILFINGLLLVIKYFKII